ncbi:TraG family protein, partial [human gut metagenome]
MSQQEDDLRALAKIMDFLRAVSIILVVMNVYWFCYEAIRLWGVNIGVVDRILLNFDRTAGLFHSILYTKAVLPSYCLPCPVWVQRASRERK